MLWWSTVYLTSFRAVHRYSMRMSETARAPLDSLENMLLRTLLESENDVIRILYLSFVRPIVLRKAQCNLIYFLFHRNYYCHWFLVISSPFPSKLICNWYLQLQYGWQRIYLAFKNLELPQSMHESHCGEIDNRFRTSKIFLDLRVMRMWSDLEQRQYNNYHSTSMERAYWTEKSE